MTSVDAQTLGIYERRVTEYAALTNEGVPASLRRFVSLVAPGGTVLDWGCGPGHDAVRLRASGFDVRAVDASAAMVAHVVERHALSACVETFADLEAVDAYDGVWANFSLLHAPRSDMPGHLRAARRALREGGACYVSVKLGEGERRDALGRRYTYYTESELVALLRDAGLDACERFGGDSVGLDGVSAAWIGVLSAVRP